MHEAAACRRPGRVQSRGAILFGRRALFCSGLNTEPDEVFGLDVLMHGDDAGSSRCRPIAPSGRTLSWGATRTGNRRELESDGEAVRLDDVSLEEDVVGGPETGRGPKRASTCGRRKLDLESDLGFV
eukprot:scaffold306504_cov30-Tisochrysis_lutea.AAC.1